MDRGGGFEGWGELGEDRLWVERKLALALRPKRDEAPQ